MEARIFLDANVLMELFFERQQKEKVKKAIITLSDDTVLTTSILATHILFYYVEKEKFDKSVAHTFLSSYKILDMNASDYEWAYENDQGDFEDALQTACAIRNSCQKIITLDHEFAAQHAKHTPILLVR